MEHKSDDTPSVLIAFAFLSSVSGAGHVVCLSKDITRSSWNIYTSIFSFNLQRSDQKDRNAISQFQRNMPDIFWQYRYFYYGRVQTDEQWKGLLSPCLDDEPQDGNGYQTGILFPHFVSNQETTQSGFLVMLRSGCSKSNFSGCIYLISSGIVRKSSLPPSPSPKSRSQSRQEVYSQSLRRSRRAGQTTPRIKLRAAPAFGNFLNPFPRNPRWVILSGNLQSRMARL